MEVKGLKELFDDILIHFQNTCLKTERELWFAKVEIPQTKILN